MHIRGSRTGLGPCLQAALGSVARRTLGAVLALAPLSLAAPHAIASEYCEAPLPQPLAAAVHARASDCLVDASGVDPATDFIVDVSSTPDARRTWVQGARKLAVSELATKSWLPRDDSLLVIGDGVTRASDERLCARLRELGFDQARVLRGGVARAVRALDLSTADASASSLALQPPSQFFEAIEAGELHAHPLQALRGEDGTLRLDAIADLFAERSDEEILLLTGSDDDYAQLLALGALPAHVFLLAGGASAYQLFKLDRSYASASRGGALQRCAAPY